MTSRYPDRLDPEHNDKYLLRGATLCGCLDIPKIEPPAWLPPNPVFVPFSQRERRMEKDTVVCFNEADFIFRDVIEHPDGYIDDLARFGAIVSPDCSMYRDAPLARQVANLYLNRRTGSFLQRHGLTVIPQIRWGSRSTFTLDVFPQRIAFLGVEPRTDVAIGSYGCFQSHEDKQVFLEGFDAMIENLSPRRVFVYGGGASFFETLSVAERGTSIVNCPDWITRLHRKDNDKKWEAEL